MKKSFFLCTVAIALALCLFSGCAESTVKMSLEDVGEAVVNNRSMVGAGGIIGENIKETVMFQNDDPNKMRYITNNLHTEDYSPSFDVEIESGRYYEAFTEYDETKTYRGVICFLKFKDTESATEAAEIIKNNINTSMGNNSLNCTEVAENKNMLCVIATQEPQPCFELNRVFEDDTYVK